MKRRKPVRAELLKERLDQLVATFDVSTIEPDPLQLVLRFNDPLDQEVAGLIAAAFAYGRADIIVANIGVVLARMKPSPYRYLRTFDAREATKRFAGFAHRFHKTPDLVGFLQCLADVIRTHGSIGTLFEKCYDSGASDIGPSLSRFVSAVMASVPDVIPRVMNGADATVRSTTTPHPPSAPSPLTRGEGSRSSSLSLRQLHRRGERVALSERSESKGRVRGDLAISVIPSGVEGGGGGWRVPRAPPPQVPRLTLGMTGRSATYSPTPPTAPHANA